jgi:hypothetical protein
LIEKLLLLAEKRRHRSKLIGSASLCSMARICFLAFWLSVVEPIAQYGFDFTVRIGKAEWRWLKVCWIATAQQNF